MKRPRRAKKAVRKAAPKKKRLSPAQRLIKSAKRQLAAIRKNDPFHLSERLIPAGWGYQWKIKGEPVPPGWSCVPYSRHAHDFPRSANHQGAIVIRGMILMEALKDQIVSELHVPQKLAMDWGKDREIGMGVTFDRGTGWPLMDPDEVVTKVLKNAPSEYGPDIETPISLLVKVPARWAAAAAYLNLSIAEYTRRRIVGERMILGCPSDQGGLEGIYEPVHLMFQPVHKEDK